MTSLEYEIEDLNDKNFIQVPRNDPNNKRELYYKTADGQEIYPRIYPKLSPQRWTEYCLLDNKKRYYAKNRLGIEYYPKDFMGLVYVLSDQTENPIFLSNSNVTFVNIKEMLSPFKGATNPKFQAFIAKYVTYVAQPERVGNLYFDVMTVNRDTKYLKWKAAGLKDERFSLIESELFRNFAVYVESDSNRRFVFMHTERCYVEGNSYIDYDLDLPYEFVLNRKLYFSGDGCFVFDHQHKKHYILSTDDNFFYAYRIRDNQMEIYLPDTPKVTIFKRDVSFIEGNAIDCEFDEEKYLVSFFEKDNEDIYLRYDADAAEIEFYKLDKKKQKISVDPKKKFTKKTLTELLLKNSGLVFVCFLFIFTMLFYLFYIVMRSIIER
jgi:hypothetical protein